MSLDINVCRVLHLAMMLRFIILRECPFLTLAILSNSSSVRLGGLTIYGRFHSDMPKTFLRFHVDNGKITKMGVGQINY